MHESMNSEDDPIRVLLVDDSPTFLELESHYFSGQPKLRVVGRATSGEGAISQVASLHPDLVLMDWTMPGINGLQAATEIKGQPNPPRIIMVTLHDQPVYREMSETVGVDGFLSKDNFGEPLMHMINVLFDTSALPPA